MTSGMSNQPPRNLEAKRDTPGGYRPPGLGVWAPGRCTMGGDRGVKPLVLEPWRCMEVQCQGYRPVWGRHLRFLGGEHGGTATHHASPSPTPPDCCPHLLPQRITLQPYHNGGCR